MFLVVFRNRKRPGFDAAAYDAAAERMETLAKAQPGYRSFKSYTADDGEVVAVSEWESEEAAKAWRNHAEHAAVQAEGRSGFYEEYTLFACAEPRVHHFKRAGS